MTTHLELYQLAARHGLDRPATQRLIALGGFDAEPPALRTGFWRAVAVAAAALGGLGMVLWIAANWEVMGRMLRFALLQGFVLAMCLGAAWSRRARAPLGLLALVGIGGLLAYFGQTYQTGADPWQLFALWAALALPLALAARSDVLWLPWLLVAYTGLALWTQAHTGHTWRVQRQDLAIHAAAMVGMLLLWLLVSPLLRRWTGAGTWALRGAAVVGTGFVTMTAGMGLFDTPDAPQYVLGLAVLALSTVLAARQAWFDVFVLSACALGLNVLVVCGLAHGLLRGTGDLVGELLFIGLLAAGLVALSVQGVLRLSRRGGW
ncbi:MAG: DUF2157 domain-containing protein [Acidovorax sp.]|uniref:DUF2157 domain-containing protein n=1 Tax=Acidovorax sp. TaxID=1872122 RepID=UPI0039E2DE6B